MGHTTEKLPSTNHQKPDSIEHVGGIGSEDSTSKVWKTSTLLSDILEAFDKELHNQTAEFEKNLQEQREKE